MNIIETERLILRTWEDKDIEPMAAIDQDPKVCEYLPGIGNRAATEAGIQRIIKHYAEHGFSLYAVELKTTHEFIGFLGLMIPSFEAHFTPAVEIGWRLASHHWGHGFATEGAKAVLKYAFNQLKLKEIVSFTVPANIRSIRVMEKIGMNRDLSGNFHHPKLPLNHPLSLHVLYRIKNEKL
jgi:RimJ/RimL family protein N-acetyltransferase